MANSETDRLNAITTRSKSNPCSVVWVEHLKEWVIVNDIVLTEGQYKIRSRGKSPREAIDNYMETADLAPAGPTFK